MHECPYGSVKPKTNDKFWADKRTKTRERDQRINDILNNLGWKVLEVWECETSREDLADMLKKFLEIR